MAKRMLLGITGGIAAYKTPDLVRLLIKKGFDVRVAMTKNAELFVTPTALRSVSGHRVLTADWNTQDDPFDHLNVGAGLSMALVAPATANFLGKLANGVADDLLLTTVLALECPLFVAPAMNPRMYANPAVQENIKTLTARGVTVIPPSAGAMACGDEGEGRLPALETLVAMMEKAAGLRADLSGKKVIVTAGPTEEPIDAVRFISNRSSGRMGVAIAQAARERGAEVTLIHGPLAVAVPENVVDVPVRTANEMLNALTERFGGCDMLVMAAAVADFRPTRVSDAKVKKSGAELSVALEPNPDILERMGKMKGGRVIVGFAAETENLLANAREKLMKKNLDLVCANDVGRSDIGFDSAYNEVVVLGRAGEPLSLPRMAKETAAHRILDEAVKLLPPSTLAAARG